MLRNIVLLGLIPRQPRSRTVAELQRELAARGFDVSTRTLQRDLANKLAAEFPIYCDDTAPPYRWSFDKHAQFNLPAVDPAAALAMYLSEGHLQRVLPPAVLDALAPQFAEAKRQLADTAGSGHLGAWACRVRAVPIGPATVPAQVALDVWEATADAVLRSRQLRVEYLSRSKGVLRDLVLHPQGIVSRGVATYLVGSVNGYADLRHFALHRIRSAETLAAPAEDRGFDIESYLKVAAFAPRHSDAPVVLSALTHPRLAWSLREHPIGRDQRLTASGQCDWEVVEVTVTDDEETFRRVRAQGTDIRLLSPEHWRERLINEAAALVDSYGVKSSGMGES